MSSLIRNKIRHTSLIQSFSIENDKNKHHHLMTTFATRMLLAGNVGELVRKITRHTRPETLLDHYTNIDMASAQAVGQKLEKFNQNQGRKGKVKGEAKKKAPGK